MRRPTGDPTSTGASPRRAPRVDPRRASPATAAMPASSLAAMPRSSLAVMPRSSLAAMLALSLAGMLALSLSGCRGMHLHGGAADAGELGDAGDAAAAEVVDAAPPADDILPSTPTEELTTRAKHLLEAIGRDDPQLAADILFPRDGWLATRDAADPGKDWDKRLVGPFRRAIHAASRRHPEYEHAQSVSFELGRTMVQQTVARHRWTKPLWTVRDSRVTFVVDGRTRTLTIREMTAWRGAWYVTRLR